MKGFFELAKKYVEYDGDYSYPLPEHLMFMRLQELAEKRKFYLRRGEQGECRTRLTENEIRYAPTAYFETARDAETAIYLAIDDLRTLYGITLTDAEIKEAMEWNTEIRICEPCGSWGRYVHSAYQYQSA